MIRLDSVTKRYPNGQLAVNGLSLEVADGETCILIGPSGCGKTTTLKMINRLIEPTSGRIFLNDEDVTRVDPIRLRRRMGYVIQQVGLFPHETIEANIATVPRLLGWDRARVRARVGELLELVGLDAEYRRRYPAQLSGGQRQRVGVARALAADPPVLLMDEPFGAIDPVTRGRLQDEFLRLQGEVHKTVVFVTHDVEEAIKLGTRIAILEVGGVLQQYDTPAEVLARPANRMVADFVGADRALKRLKVTPIPLDGVTAPPTIAPSATLEAARAVMARENTDWLAVVDGNGVLRGEITEDDADGTGIVSDHARRVEAWISVDDSLEAALAATLLTESGRVAVIDGDRFLGVLTPTTIHRALRNSVDATPEPASLETP